MQLTCPGCGVSIPADDVNLDTAIAKCRGCHCVFDFTDQVRTDRSGQPQRQAVEMPRGFAVDDLLNRLTITRKWFGPAILALAVFVVVWDGFLVVWYSTVFARNAPLAMTLFPVIHLAVGMGLTYYVMAGFVNKTIIDVDVNQLTVRHGPLPWPGQRDIDPASIDQVYCTEKVHRGKHGYRYTYRVHAKMIDGRPVKLVSGLTRPEQALFFEQQLEKWLGLTDRAVAGEMPNHRGARAGRDHRL